MNDVPPPPSLTDELREQARRSPGKWFYAIHPFFDPGGEVPPYGIIGAWQADERGEISGEFRHNPNYRPSPVALDYPDPPIPWTMPSSSARPVMPRGRASFPCFWRPM